MLYIYIIIIFWNKLVKIVEHNCLSIQCQATPFCKRQGLWSYHFVECKSHFVEKTQSPLQNGPPRPHPGNGKEDQKITKSRSARRWPIACWQIAFLGAPCSSKMSSKQALDMAGLRLRCFLNELLKLRAEGVKDAFVRDFPPKLKVEDVMIKLSLETSLKN